MLKALRKITDQARVFAALYNHAQPQGMGYLHYDATPMTEQEATDIVAQIADRHGNLHLDYFKGRVMKITIMPNGSHTSVWGYERDNGKNSVEEALTCPGCSNCKK